MDIDRFISRNQSSWERLDVLVAKGRRSVRKLSPEELDELLALYQRTSTHLSIVRTQFDDLAVGQQLSRSLGAARGVIYRRRARPGPAVARFFQESFPAAAWQCRRAFAVAALLLLVPAVGYGVWLHQSGNVLDAAIDPATQELIATSEFENYYKSSAAEGWAFELFTHNIQVAATAFAGGAAGGVFGVYALVYNGANVGVMGAVMHTNDRGALFWGLILPHGLLELTSIVIAAGAGLRIAWTMFVPGERSRSAALAEEGLRSMTVLLGAMVMLVAAGFTEAFVTPSSLPTWARVAIGVVLEALALTWMFGLGRNLERVGITGRLDEDGLVELERAELERAEIERAQVAASAVG